MRTIAASSPVSGPTTSDSSRAVGRSAMTASSSPGGILQAQPPPCENDVSRTEGCVTVLMQSKRTGTRVGHGPTVPAVARVRAPRILLAVQRLVTTAGHVDHGKSTLVRALTGHDPDRWEEERARGLTIDLGFEWTTRTRLRDGFIGPAAVAHPRRWDHLD